MLRSPQLFRAKVSCWFIHLASVDSPRRVREILVPHGRNTMVTLLPWDSRPVGNPMFRSHDTLRRVRRSVRFLHWDHFPTLSDGRLLMPRITSRVHPQTASSVLRLVADWTAGSWNSGSLAFAIPPGLAERRATMLSLLSAFVTCYFSRCLSARGEFHNLQHVSPMLTHNGNIVCRDMAHMRVGPVNTGIPHQKRSSLHSWLPPHARPYTVALEATTLS
jgi:hypothetical protein